MKHVSSLSANKKERLLFWKGKYYTSASSYLPKSGFQPYHTAGLVKSFIQLHSLLSKENPKWKNHVLFRKIIFQSIKAKAHRKHLPSWSVQACLGSAHTSLWGGLQTCEGHLRKGQREAKMRAYSAPENRASSQKETCYSCFSIPPRIRALWRAFSRSCCLTLVKPESLQWLKCQEQVCPPRISTLS